MADEAKFSVRLIDKVRGPGRAMAKALGRVRGQVSGLGKALGRHQGRLKKLRTWAFGSKGGIKGERGAGGKFLKGQQGFFGKHLGRAMKRTGNAAGGMWRQVAGGHLAAEAIMQVGRLGAAAAKSTWDFIKFGQRSELALGQLAKHGATGPKLFELGRTLAKKYGQDVQDTTVNLQKLLSAQFDPKLATDIIKMGADLRAIGSSAEDAKGAVRAITQIKGAGRLMGDELLQLSEAGISIELVRGEIGKILGGKSIQEVIKLQESGKIDADTAIAGILAAVQKKTGSKELGDAGAKFADTTIEGMLGRVKALGQDASLEITKRLEAPITKFVSGKARAFSDWMESPKGAKTLDMLGSGLEKALGLFEAVSDAAGGTFLHVMTAVGDVVEPVLKALGTEGETATQVARTLGKVLGFVAAGFVVAVGAAAALQAGVMFLAGAVVEGAIGAWDWMIEKLGDAVLWFEGLDAKLRGIDLGDAALGIGKSIVMGVLRGIEAMIPEPVKAMGRLGGELLDKISTTLGIRSPSTKMFDKATDTVDGWTIGVQRGERSVQAAGHGLATAHLGGFNAGLTTGTGLGSPVTSSGGFDLGGSTSAFDFGDLTSAALPAPRLDSSQVGSGRGPIRVDLHTEVHAAGGDADEIARLSARSSRRELEDFFRELDLES